MSIRRPNLYEGCLGFKVLVPALVIYFDSKQIVQWTTISKSSFNSSSTDTTVSSLYFHQIWVELGWWWGYSQVTGHIDMVMMSPLMGSQVWD